MAKEAVDVLGDLKLGPVIGTGPWVLTSAEEDVGTFFERNVDYFEEGLPFLDEFGARVIKEEDQALAAFLVGQIQAYRIPPAQWSELLGEGRSIPNVLVGQGGTGLLLSMNTSRPPFDNLQVRRALLKALDPWDYVDSTWAGQGFVSLGLPVGAADWLLSREEMRGNYFADRASARQTLLDLSLPSPPQFDLFAADFGDLHRALAERITQDLEAAGFDPRLTFLNPAQYAEMVVRDGRYQAALGVLPPTTGTTNFPPGGTAQQGAVEPGSPQRRDPGRYDRDPGCDKRPGDPKGPDTGASALPAGSGLYLQPHHWGHALGVGRGGQGLLPQQRGLRIFLLGQHLAGTLDTTPRGHSRDPFPTFN